MSTNGTHKQESIIIDKLKDELALKYYQQPYKTLCCDRRKFIDQLAKELENEQSKVQ